jgi:polar amino acid transport system substrate-binding protein
MKKIISLISITLICVLMFTACSKKDDDKKTNEDGATAITTVEDGKLTICSDIPYPPFEFLEGDETVGVDPDIMRAIAKDNDLEATFLDVDFDSIFAQLAAGSCDVIASSVSITDERKEANDFSDPYYEIKQSLLVNNADKDTLTDLDKLEGKVVGVQSETTGANGYTVTEFTGADEIFAALRAGTIDASIQDYPVNYGESNTNGATTITISFDGDEQYGFVISKDNPELTKAINASLKKIRDNGEYDSILEKYLGESQ